MANNFRLVVIVPSPLLGPVMEQLQIHPTVRVVEQELMIVKEHPAKLGKKAKAATPKTGLRVFVKTKLGAMAPDEQFRLVTLSQAVKEAGFKLGSFSSAIAYFTQKGVIVKEGSGIYRIPAAQTQETT